MRWRLLLDGRFSEALVNMGRVYAREKDTARAIEKFNLALSLTDSTRVKAEIYYVLGNFKIRDGDIASARESMEQAVLLDPNFPLGQVGLAKVKFFQMGSIKDGLILVQYTNEALSHIEKAIAQNPNQTLAYFWQGAYSQCRRAPRGRICKSYECIARSWE